MDIRVPGLVDDRGEPASEDARRKAIEADKMAYREATDVLKRLSMLHFPVMENLCFYELPISQIMESVAKRGLSAMALHFKILPVDVYAP